MNYKSNKAHEPKPSHPWKRYNKPVDTRIKEWAAEATVSPYTNSVRRKSEVYNHKNGIN